MEKTPIKSFRDLIVYQNLYEAMKIVLIKIIPKLPSKEKYDLSDQMNRACKAAPALLAEGFAKRYQRLQWRKYLNDTLGECDEMIHHLSVCIDIYSNFVNKEDCEKARNIYEISCKQLTRLGQVWKDYHQTHPQ